MEIIDDRLGIYYSTYPLATKLQLETKAIIALTYQHYYDPNTKTWKPLEAGNIVTSLGKAYFWPAAISDLTEAGWYELRIDKQRRLYVLLDAENVGLSKEKTAHASVAAADNTAGLSLELYKEGRRYVSVYYKTSDAATITISVSRDGSTWRTYRTISLSAAGEDIVEFETGYPYVKVESSDTGIDLEFEICASW